MTGQVIGGGSLRGFIAPSRIPRLFCSVGFLQHAASVLYAPVQELGGRSPYRPILTWIELSPMNVGGGGEKRGTS